MNKMKKNKIQNHDQKKIVYTKPKLIALGDIRDVTMGGSIGTGDSGNAGTEKPFGTWSHVRYLNLKKNNQEKFNYRIADSFYQSNVRINALEGFNIGSGNSTIVQNLMNQKPQKSFNIYNDKAFIGDTQYSLVVDSISDNSRYCLKANEKAYRIDNNIIQFNDIDIDETLLLGPCLIINLALNNVFCLHASAFVFNNKIFVLMANSGTGKSTIARFMDTQADCQRIADDILPLNISKSKLTILPAFPQLKLSQDQQYKGGKLTMDTVLLFAEKSKETTSVQSIDTFSSIKKLIKHSVATKLFAEKELQNHLSFCHQTSTLVKSYKVKYQHTDNSLQKFYGLLDDISWVL